MQPSTIASLSALCLVLVAASNVVAADHDPVLHGPGASPATAQPSLALGFIRNDGQWDERVRFTTTGSGLSAGFLDHGFLMYLLRTHADRAQASQAPGLDSAGLRVDRAPVEFTFEGAPESVCVEGEGLLEPYVNYFIGRDPARWATRVPTYASVRYTGLYEGIDVVVKKPDARVEYDLVLAPEADPALVRVRVRGASSLRIDERGGLEMQTPLGVLCQHPPLAYEILPDGSRRPVECSFQLLSEDVFGFRVPAREPGASLVIDPVVEPPAYFTYLGGELTGWEGWDGDMATDIAVLSGRATVTGCTASLNFPTGGEQGNPPYPYGNFHGECDAFVTRLDAWGTSIRWSTFFGGEDIDVGYGVEVDGTGAAYVGGFTRSYSMVTTAPPPGAPFQGTMPGAGDGFVLKLNPSGTEIVYSTYLGSSEEDTVSDLKVDGLGHAYVCGYTNWYSSLPPGGIPFPIAGGAVVEPTTEAYWYSGFVSKVAPDGTGLVYSTYVRAYDPTIMEPQTQCVALALHIDDSDPTNVAAFVTGVVQHGGYFGNNIPRTTNAFQWNPGGGDDAFVIGLNASATAYVYGSYYGGSNDDIGLDIAAYSDGLALTGHTYSNDLPLVNAWQTSNGGSSDAFIARFRPYAVTPVGSVPFSTYFGGSGEDAGTAIDTDATGRKLFCVGNTRSANFPTTSSALFPAAPGIPGGPDVFFSRFQTYSLDYSTYLGGEATDEAYGLATDSSGYYIAGLSAKTPTVQESDFYEELVSLFPQLPGYQTVPYGGDDYDLPGSGIWAPYFPVHVTNMIERTDAFVLKLLSP